jgi:hypothetical protein
MKSTPVSRIVRRCGGPALGLADGDSDGEVDGKAEGELEGELEGGGLGVGGGEGLTVACVVGVAAGEPDPVGPTAAVASAEGLAVASA